MKLEKLFLSLALTSFAFASTPSFADESGGLEVKMVVQEEIISINKQGEKVVKLVKPESIIPGDTVVYTTFVVNKRTDIAEDVAIQNPIPKEIAYIAGSATGSSSTVTYSVDGGKTFGAPETLTVMEGDKERPATHKDYTHILWTLPKLAPEEQAQVSFHGILK